MSAVLDEKFGTGGLDEPRILQLRQRLWKQLRLRLQDPQSFPSLSDAFSANLLTYLDLIMPVSL